MKIQTNTAANSALGYARINAQATERSIQKLSSGFRINRAGDDAAGLALANVLRADGKALAQAQKNAAQGSAMLQIMDGAAQTVSTILDRMKELATQANSANVGTQAGKLDAEFQALQAEITRISQTTKYQGTALVNGTFGASVDTNTANSTILAGGTNVTGAALSGAPGGATITITNAVAGKIVASYTDGAGQVVSQTVNAASNGAQTVTFDKIGFSLTLGTGYSAAGTAVSGALKTLGTTAAFQVSSSSSYGAGGNDLISVGAVDLTAATLGVSGLNLTNAAATALTAVDSAIGLVNTALGTIGAAESRFDFATNNVATMQQNTVAAESTIRDADMAYEMTQFTKNNILQQAAQSMLAQANQGSQGILQLLRG